MKKFLSILLCVCLLTTSIFTMPMVSAEEQDTATEYFYLFNDYESLEGTEKWLTTIERGDTMSVESGENTIGGTKSLKVTSDGVNADTPTSANYISIGLSPETFPANFNARISFDYKVTTGKIEWGKVGYVGSTYKYTEASPEKLVNCYHWKTVNDKKYSVDIGNLPKVESVSTVRTYKGTLARNTTGTSYPIGIFYNDGAVPAEPSEVVFDNLKIAEIIGTVVAVSADETKGTATVTNKDGYEDYAKNEIAVFTATPNEGYSFVGWYNNEGVLVSNKATYEHTLTGDTTLTAKYEKEYFYLFNDYESLEGTEKWLTTIERGDTMSVEGGENVIGGTKSLKVTSDGVNADTPTSANYISIGLSSETFPANFNARISFDYKVTKGKIEWGKVGYVGSTYKYTETSPEKLVACYHWKTVNDKKYSVDIGNLPKVESVSTVKTYKGTLARNTTGTSYPIGIFYNDGAVPAESSEVVFDNLKIAQIIDTVSATSADETMGSVTLVNKAGYEDYAKGEVAVFTATPNESYSFVGWYNTEDELVSTDKKYEVTLTSDTDLTAKFAALKVVNISFNTNGGNAVEPISNYAGADIVMPAAPEKAGFTFAGWYTDETLANRFTATTFPAEDITLYAKWINGSYQDFENYEGTPSGNFEVLTDGENSYLGKGYLKYSADTTDGGSRLVISSTEALKDFASPKDKIEVSFKYKLISGDAKFYMHTSSNANKPTLTNLGTNEAGKTVWLNAYEFKNTDLTVSEAWQEITSVYDLKAYSKVISEGFTVEDFLYSILFLTSENGAELYIDEITLSVIPNESIKTAYNNVAALRSAAASSTGKNGLRIYNEIDSYWVDNNNIVEYGSIAAYSSNIDGEITLENGNKGVAFSDGTLSPEKYSVWDITADTVIFTSYITNVGKQNYGATILIRSYAIAENGTVYYGKTTNVSVFDVANAMDNAQTADGSEPTETDKSAFYAFVNDANYTVYATWCTENGKGLGTLYNDKYAA